MKPNRAIVAAAYLVVAGLILTPVIETALSTWPVRAGDESWLYSAAGITSRSLIVSLLGLVLAVGFSFLAGHTRVLRSLAVASGLGSLVLLTISGALVLDALELTGSVSPEEHAGFDLASVGMIVKALYAWLVTVLLAVGGWRWSFSAKPDAEQSFSAPPLVLTARTIEPAGVEYSPRPRPATRRSPFMPSSPVRGGPRSW